MRHVSRGLSLLAISVLMVACGKGGQLTLEPDARLVKIKASQLMAVNQGGKALIVEQGQTADTGIHGWVSVQTPSAQAVMTSTDGHSMVLNQLAIPR